MGPTSRVNHPTRENFENKREHYKQTQVRGCPLNTRDLELPWCKPELSKTRMERTAICREFLRTDSASKK